MEPKRFYKKSIFYVKLSGICVVAIGGGWVLYQLRQTAQIIRSVVNTKALQLEQTQAQYIYIDDPRFKDFFLFRSKDDLHSTITRESSSLSYLVSKWKKLLNRAFAYRLLNLARNGDESDRTRAVYSISRLEDLKDWNYRYMAQMIDAKTGIALARMPNVDLRFFLKPPYYFTQVRLYDMIENLHGLLLDLDKVCKSCHPCLTQFLKKKFRDKRDGLIFDHDLTSVGLAVAPVISWDEDLLRNCIEVLYHHSSLEEHSRDIADIGGLPILMTVQKRYHDNVEICALLAKIISNLSLHSEFLEQLFESGWIGILTQWSQDKDVRLAAPAVRALANLDVEGNKKEKFPKRVYLLHPMHRIKSTSKMDVIFIHGLLGGVFVTWRQRDVGVVQDQTQPLDSFKIPIIVDDLPQEFVNDLVWHFQIKEWKTLGSDYEVILSDSPINTSAMATGPFTCSGDDICMNYWNEDHKTQTQCWPKDWLPQDVSSLRILGLNYDTNLSMWTPLCPIEGLRSTIKERSLDFLNKLNKAGVGKRPIIWVCHSMGGLLVKQMLIEEWKNGDKNKLCENTKGIVFYSTPHRGSRVAALNQTTQMLVWPSVEVQELREESPQLLKLHEEFIQMLKFYKIDIVSFSETKPTLLTALKVPFQFVSSKSSDPGVGEFYEIPQDHLSICKPANRQSFLYQKVLSIVKRHIIDSNSRENHHVNLTTHSSKTL